MKRTLSLNAERLTDLSADDLRDLGGAAYAIAATPLCVSHYFISVCECVTNHCLTSNCA